MARRLARYWMATCVTARISWSITKDLWTHLNRSGVTLVDYSLHTSRGLSSTDTGKEYLVGHGDENWGCWLQRSDGPSEKNGLSDSRTSRSRQDHQAAKDGSPNKKPSA